MVNQYQPPGRAQLKPGPGKPRSPTADVRSRHDWESERTCQLCRREIPRGEWGYADDGPLCHPNDPGLPDCYHLWTVYRKRRLDETQAGQRAREAQAEYSMLRTVEDIIAHARKISTAPAMAVYVAELERALGTGDLSAQLPHKLGGNDEGGGRGDEGAAAT